MKGSTMLWVMTMLGGGLAGRPAVAGTFEDDLAFLKDHKGVIVLADAAGEAQILVSPAMQGRVMTSTADGLKGLSYGWINRELIGSGEKRAHINAFGGEDRVWLGPEGGQFAIFFAKDAPFDYEHWQTPAPLDSEPFEVLNQAKDKVTLWRGFQLTNYSGTKLSAEIKREVRLLTPEEAWKFLGVPARPGLKLVAYQSENQLKNAGSAPWVKETGLLSVWVLGMFNRSAATTVVIPIKPGPEAELGPAVIGDYFGQVPPERLVVKDGTVFFSAMGEYRSKIGIPPRRCKPLLGSYDAANKVLTLVQFTLPEGATDYVNSAWKLQDKPYGGDVANSYNDGPAAPGAKPLGPFYELETSSPAAALKPGETLTHTHRTIHLRGSEAELDAIAKATLGVGLQQITSALPK